MDKGNSFENEKLYVKIDVEGYITAIAQEAYEGHLETEMTMEEFVSEYGSVNVTDGRHRYCDGRIVEDAGTARSRAAYEKTLREELRSQRERVCFPVVNRGQVWYDSLSEEQRLELESWYRAWLDVTETLQAPETPAWLN